MFENFGMASAVKSAAYDIVALLAYTGYALTLPIRFLWILCRGNLKGKL